MKALSSRKEEVREQKMAQESRPSAGGFNDETLMGLKEEFDRKFDEVQVSDSSEKLKEYKFLAILGQGAFGLVVIYHFLFSLFTSSPEIVYSRAI